MVPLEHSEEEPEPPFSVNLHRSEHYFSLAIQIHLCNWSANNDNIENKSSARLAFGYISNYKV